MTAYTHDLVQGEERCLSIAQERVKTAIETSATDLDLSNLGELRRIPDLGDLPNRLTSLNLTRCWGIRNFDGLRDLTKLEKLDYSFYRHTDLEPLRPLTSLKALRLFKAVGLKNLEALDSLTNLTSLNIRWSSPDDLSPLSRSTKLKWLDLSRLPVKNLSFVVPLTQLEHLNLYWCEDLSNIEHLAALTNLEELVLSRCKKVESIAVLSRLKNLRALYLWGCTQITDIAALRMLSELVTLNIAGLPIDSLTPLTHLSKLSELNASHCSKIKDLELVAQFKELEKLDLESCSQFKDIRPLGVLARLTHLNLSSIQEATGFEALTELENLQYVTLRNCFGLKSLSWLKKAAEKLKSVDLIWCRFLTDIDALADCKNLESLDLSACVRLASIEVLSKMSSLKSLNVYGIEKVVVDAASSIIVELLPRLEFLALNHFLTAPPEIFTNRPEENILTGFRAWLIDGQGGIEQEHLVKLLVLGNAGVGKTYISHALTGKELANIQSTHGVQVFRKPIDIAPYGDVFLQIWDFGGQEIYHGTHALFAERRAIFLIVWEPSADQLREYEENGISLRDYPLSYWADYVRSLQDENSAVLILQSKCDLASQEKGIPPQVGLSHLKTGHCSAVAPRMFEAEGLLKGSIQGVLERNKAEIPQNWSKVRAEIFQLMEQDQKRAPSDRQHRTLSSEEFKSMCSRHACSDEKIVRNYLSATGTVFYRQGLFNDQVILDQSWALDAIYAIFDRSKGCCREIAARLGNFDKGALQATVWNSQNLLPADEDLVLSMMKSCFICFEDPDGPHGLPSYYAPDLMPGIEAVAEKIKAYWPPVKDTTPGFKMSFTFLHVGILRKLICKVGARAGKSAIYWKYGCAFYDGTTGARARIFSEKPDEASGSGSIIIQTLDDPGQVLLGVLREAIEDVCFGSVPVISQFNLGEHAGAGVIASGDGVTKAEAPKEDCESWDQRIQPEPPPEILMQARDTASRIRIGIITALEKEYAAMKSVLLNCEEITIPGKGAGRRYCIGRIKGKSGDQVVALSLAGMGNNSAAARATLMVEHFQNLDEIIMVGIAGGVPSPLKPADHVRLGDIVISNKKGVVQYDFIKKESEFEEIRSSPVPPSARLVEAVQLLEANALLGEYPWELVIEEVIKKTNASRPDSSTDVLHASGDQQFEIAHPDDSSRRLNVPRVFLGPVGSANVLLKDPIKRDSLREQFGIRAIEMEASGIADATWNHAAGYLVVRGICDYCDTHKNDNWQNYAAAVAAAYTKVLIASLP
jgi:internalin A